MKGLNSILFVFSAIVMFACITLNASGASWSHSEKIYIPYESISVETEGIKVFLNLNEAICVNSVHCDNAGYYINQSEVQLEKR